MWGTHPTAASTGGHLLLGNPTGAATDLGMPNNYLLDRPQYALGYQRDAGIAAWASWHLGATDIGGAGRGNFAADTALPPPWYQVQPGDYTNSGYDRGHLVPSGDRTASRADNDPVFLMTNIIPQAPDNNQGPWANLENYSRSLAQSGSELYIIAGGAGQLGTLASGRLRIPARTWKIIVVLPEGDNDLARITTATRVIAVDLPNTQGIRSSAWESFLTSVDAIEALTGYDFLSAVDPSIQAVLEGRVDGQTGPTPTLGPSSTPTLTPSATATAGPTSSTPSSTPTASATAGPPSATPTASATATAGPSPTPTPTAGSAAAGIIIREFRTRGPAGGNDEFFNLFNPLAVTVDLSGWQLLGSSNSGSTSVRLTLPAGTTLAPGQSYLAVNRASTGGYSGSVAGDNPSGTFTTGIGDDGGVALVTAQGAISDQVGLSSGSAYGEGARLASFGSTNSDRSDRRLDRCADTNDNLADFGATQPSPSTPLNHAAAAQPCAALPTPTVIVTASSTATAAATVPAATVTATTAPATSTATALPTATQPMTATPTTAPATSTTTALPTATLVPVTSTATALPTATQPMTATPTIAPATSTVTASATATATAQVNATATAAPPSATATRISSPLATATPTIAPTLTAQPPTATATMPLATLTTVATNTPSLTTTATSVSPTRTATAAQTTPAPSATAAQTTPSATAGPSFAQYLPLILR